MLDAWNAVSLGLFDLLLGWTLDLPRAVAVIVVALITALVLTLVRKVATNQDRLRRAAADLGLLKTHIRAARSASDRAAVSRHKLTRAQINLIKLKAEGKPLLVYLMPIALLATWAFQRLQFDSPRADETIQLTVYVPRSAEDDLLHLVPQPGLQAVNGWVQEVRRVDNELTAWDRFWAKVTFSEVKQLDPDMVAIWQLRADAASEPYPLIIRWKDQTIERSLHVGQRIYDQPVDVVETSSQEPITAEIRLHEVRLFGIPGLGAWLPAWLVGYLLLTIPLFFGLKWMLEVY
jgi:uncharacterized membrane protein (DUF106 family)